jgi:lipopolysaccharide transport system permease protein
VIRPQTGWPRLNLGEVWQFRDLLLILGVRDLKLRYKQTILGVAWVIIQPLLAGGVLSFVFGGVAGMESGDGAPMFLIAFLGTVGWNLFARTALGGTQAMIGSAHLVSKIYFPRVIMPATPITSVLVDLVIVLPLALLVAALTFEVTWLHLLMLPVCGLILIMMGAGLGLGAAAAAVHFRDVKHIMPLTIQMLMLLSPVGYTLAHAVDWVQSYGLGWAYLYLNPLAPVIAMFRWSIIGTAQPPWSAFAVSGGVALLVLYGGLLIFKRMERTFADVI